MAIKILCILIFLLNGICLAANYSLEIIQPQEGLTAVNRYYKAYPGIEYKVPIGVFGGSYPFTYELTTTPSGMTIDSDTGIITWSNPTVDGSPHSVAVRVTDAESNTDTASWTITVTTTGFIFIDSEEGTHSIHNGCSSDCGDGTISNPFLDIGDVFAGVVDVVGEDFSSAYADTAYDGYFVYFRGGTYVPKGTVHLTGTVEAHIDWRSHKPMIWLEYPGETVVLDHDGSGASESGAFFKVDAGSTSYNYFFQGIKFQDMKLNSWYIYGSALNSVFFDCAFENMTQGTDGSNPGFIMEGGTGLSGTPTYHLICNNTFDEAGGDAGSYVKLYGINKGVVSDNTFTETTAASVEGLALKAYLQYIDVRNNKFYGLNSHVINGNWNTCGYMEIRYNLVLDAYNDYDTSAYGALTINHDNSSGEVFIYRNTFDGTVTLRTGTADDGPFQLYDNVIINENADQDNPNGSYVTQYSVTDDSCLVLGTGDDANLVGSASDAIIDASGDLTGVYVSYVGSKGYQLDDEEEPVGGSSVAIGSGNGAAYIGTGNGSITFGE